jgi:hypothetical protein
MDSAGYQAILENYLKPFAADKYPLRYRLWQDNDPKHVSKSTQKWMAKEGITHWPTPPESPDLNPIERVWAALKFHIRRRVKPTLKEQLTQGIRDFWGTVDVDTCERYISHIPKAADMIIRNRGGPAGH